MFKRLNLRLLNTPTRPSAEPEVAATNGRGPSRPADPSPPGLVEGVYFNPTDLPRLHHYALDGASGTLCGRRSRDLTRWASIWSPIPTGERCPKCEARVGERGNVRHGPLEYGDSWYEIDTTTLTPPERAEYLRWRLSHLEIEAKEPPLPGPESAFSDPPFVYLEDPAITRRRVLTEPHVTRVINDVYVRIRSGQKWHRVHHIGFENLRAGGTRASKGRGFAFVCGAGADEFMLTADGAPSRTPLRTDAPEPDSFCNACRQSDAKYGRGEIASVTRWDR